MSKDNPLEKWLAVALAMFALWGTGCSARSVKATLPEPNGFPNFGDNAVVYGHDCGPMTGGVASMAGDLPKYPRATEIDEASDAQGLVLVYATDDSFEAVYHWYLRAMPSGAERHVSADCKGITPTTAPAVAVFSVGALGKDYRAVMILEIPADARAPNWPKDKKLPRTMIALQQR